MDQKQPYQPDAPGRVPANNSGKSGASKAILAVILIVAVLAVGGVVVAIAMNQNTSAPGTTQQSETHDTHPTQEVDDSSAPAAGNSDTATITFTNSGFSPSTLTIKQGTKVTVINKSDTDVEFSSDDHPTHRENTEMNTQEIGPGERTSFTATTVGTHGFHDHIDDSKTGTLIVTE